MPTLCPNMFEIRIRMCGCRGAFALFSLLKRQAELGRGSRSLNRSLSQYSAYPKGSSMGRQSSSGGVGAGAVAPDSYKQRFIESPWTQRVLTVLVCVGVGAIMGDGTSLVLSDFDSRSLRHASCCSHQGFQS